MSRSYGKTSRGRPMWRGWHKFMRARERLAIHREMNSVDRGDVIFPIVSEVSSPWGGDCYSHDLYYKKDIRDRYSEEIRNILNGYCESRHWRNYEDFESAFLEAFNVIRNGKSQDGTDSRFEWLNTREAKEAIKEWNGDPVDVLYHLTRTGIIEKAIRNECKRISRK